MRSINLNLNKLLKFYNLPNLSKTKSYPKQGKMNPPNFENWLLECLHTNSLHTYIHIRSLRLSFQTSPESFRQTTVCFRFKFEFRLSFLLSTTHHVRAWRPALFCLSIDGTHNAIEVDPNSYPRLRPPTGPGRNVRNSWIGVWINSTIFSMIYENLNFLKT